MRKSDLIGQRFGNLTVKQQGKSHVMPSGVRRIMWECECDCGKQCIVSTGNLTSGHTKSCGCIRIKDLTGQKFGRLTVVRRTDNHYTISGNSKIMWECVCECGGQCVCSSESLISGHTTSCGCYAIESKKHINAVTFDVDNNIAKIHINSTDLYTIIDLDDYDRIKNFSWSLKDGSYVASFSANKKYGTKLLHRIIMNCYDERLVVDHINGDTLDNRKCNLRICTKQQNGFNQTKFRKNSSGFIGVTKRKNKWYSRIRKNGILYNLGGFDNIEDAISARLKAEQELFGEYARPYNKS